MPDVLTFIAGARFVASTRARVITAPDRVWQQTLEFVAGADGNLVDIEGLATDIGQFFAALLVVEAQVFEVRVSTWEADSHPYDPTAFYVDTTVRNGAYTSIGNPAPLDTCMAISKHPQTGRNGALPLRAAIRQNEYSASLHGRSFVSLSDAQARFAAAFATSGLDLHVGVEGATLQLAMIDAGGNARIVLDMGVTGIREVKTKHKWFNRA